MSEIALEAWGEHEALLLKPPRSPLSLPPPKPRPAGLFPRRGGVPPRGAPPL